MEQSVRPIEINFKRGATCSWVAPDREDVVGPKPQDELWVTPNNPEVRKRLAEALKYDRPVVRSGLPSMAKMCYIVDRKEDSQFILVRAPMQHWNGRQRTCTTNNPMVG